MSVLVIAEIGNTHDGSLGNAKRLIDAAVAAGADAVKFQTHLPDAEMVASAPAPAHFQDEPRFQYFTRTGFAEQQWRELKQHAQDQGALFLSSPFSVAAVELLERIGVERYKIPSGEVTNLLLLDAVAATGKPVLLSSGMSSWDELDAAVAELRPGGGELTLLQCTSEYPCSYEHVGLNVMLEMRERYDAPVGLSDHTLTSYASLTAVVLGATVVEKHFAFSRQMYGGDAKISLEPDELAALVQGVRAVETMLAHDADKNDVAPYRQVKDVYEKSVVAAVDIPAGTIVGTEMLAVKRPGTGLAPRLLPSLVGRRASRDLERDTLIADGDLLEAG